jgi:hypothetical protein
MTPISAGQQVRIANVPDDIVPRVDTGTVVRMLQAYADDAGAAPDEEMWLIQFDLTHFERVIPRADLTPLHQTGDDAWHRIFDGVPQRRAARQRRARRPGTGRR